MDDLDLLDAHPMSRDETTCPELIVVLEHLKLGCAVAGQGLDVATNSVAELIRGEALVHVDWCVVDGDDHGVGSGWFAMWE